MKTNYDIIVIGGGHAGCEAACAAAKMGCSTLLVSLELNKLAAMPCNPAIGGPGKAHLVREIDALGGIMGKLADKTLIQIRLLNTSKGAAVQAYRAQIEKQDYTAEMLKTLKKTKNLDLLEDEVTKVQSLPASTRSNRGEKFKVKNGIKITGISTKLGKQIRAKAVIITTGTFLNGQLMIDKKIWPGGRIDAPPTSGLSKCLKKLGLVLNKLMTDTPPRIHKDSVNYKKTTIQPGTKGLCSFSFPDREIIKQKDQVPCFLTYTNSKTHQIILKNLKSSPLFIYKKDQALTPRHCPSLDEKIVNFPDRKRHPVFIEPEGKKSDWIYLQGCYIAMLEKIQGQIIHSIQGLEKAKILQYGYAISYDFVPPHQIKNNLETKKISGLFLAGQINGTSGYEEAAAQGLLAGINAALKIKKKSPFILKRNGAYIGVLVDDLVTKIHREPYRIFTSRAEYRLLLRQDNADLRLTKYGYKLGLVSKKRYREILKKEKLINDTVAKLKKSYLKLQETSHKSLSYFKFLSQPQNTLNDLKKMVKLPSFSPDIKKQIEIIASYEGYLKRQEKEVEKAKKLENKKIPSGIDYDKIPGLRNEARERLKEVCPQTLGQASRLEGMTLADFSILSIWLYRRVKSFN
jgi:tRNA uridine 5-carboxymethylaminomethyl modification enzyme